MSTTIATENAITWFYACNVQDVPANGGVCVKYGEEQIALFRFARRNEWYASQNECPHRRQMALSRGMTGTQEGEPKIACPFHKKTFSLKDGRCISDPAECAITTYPVRIENDRVYIGVDGASEC
ncbi:nitrite reductase small subunit NirD [Chitinophaga tropicalis]|uniref:Nitrite reductase small subunit NirD n=1 Tax=Chitinophaga tropicalis TaxID=2683588 RepID=A0A7K1UBQ7_9BACT|nr:nitrite reductase small subunit NirD [Chitinophaga tropicalis]MVT11736.1 nitrite reductase small subunit NirD [Chitinophaga tropicalis]